MAGKGGLEGVVAATSSLCYIDGTVGYLCYRGIDIFELAKYSSFEETAYLLLYGSLPTQSELDGFRNELKTHRNLSTVTETVIDEIWAKSDPMEALRTGISTMSWDDDEKDINTHEANLRKAARIVGRTASIIGRLAARRAGREPVASDPSLDHAANLLWLITGKKPTERATDVFDQCLILHMDHELPASTFAGRVTAATLSDMYSALTSAVGALKGPLHGGANMRVMETLEKIGSVENVETWVKAALDRKERIMGFGHRVYKTYDPRAKILKELAAGLAKENPAEAKWYEMSLIVEDVVMREKGLFPNVDFYAACVYRMLGIPTPLFTTIFAASRVIGWSAHVIEQHDDNRLIRPSSDYTGPTEAPYVVMSDRVPVSV